MRRFCASTSRTCTSTCWLVETILPGWMFFLVQLISETWIRPFHARLQLNERAVVGDVGDRALEACADRILGLDAGPRIGLQLLHAEADALRLGIDAHDLHLDRIADVDDLASDG